MSPRRSYSKLGQSARSRIGQLEIGGLSGRVPHKLGRVV